MGKLLVIKNANFSTNAIDTLPVPPSKWAIGYKALYEKYLALSRLSEQDFLNKYCTRGNLSSFYFIDREQICTGKTITKMYTIGYPTKDVTIKYGICDGMVNNSISNPTQIGSIPISTGTSGILNLNTPLKVPLGKYYYWQHNENSGLDCYHLDKTKLAPFKPTDLENVGMLYDIPGYGSLRLSEFDVLLM